MHALLSALYLQLVAPFSAQILMLQLDNLPVDLRPLYSGHTDSILLVGDESGFRDIRVIIPNLVSLTFGIVQSGGRIFTEAPLDNTTTIHVEMFKVLDGEWFRIDPTPFLQPLSDPQVNIEFDCNDVVVYIGGTIVERRFLLESTEIVTEIVGNPLVQGSILFSIC